MTTPGATYTGLAIGGTASAPFCTPPTSAEGRIDVFDGTFTNVTGTTSRVSSPTRSFADGLVPFNVQNIGGNIYVTYAPAAIGANRTPQTMATAGQGSRGDFRHERELSPYVINFDQTGSHLAAPWGIALAPAGFGPFSGDLLVGNFPTAISLRRRSTPTTR